jgi:hypothetical protein
MLVLVYQTIQCHIKEDCNISIWSTVIFMKLKIISVKWDAIQLHDTDSSLSSWLFCW